MSVWMFSIHDAHVKYYTHLHSVGTVYYNVQYRKYYFFQQMHCLFYYLSAAVWNQKPNIGECSGNSIDENFKKYKNIQLKFAASFPEF
jgi:hypothetical protein